MTTDNTHTAALQAIANAAPEIDPGEGEWTSISAAYLAGVTQGQYVAAVTARAALAGQAPAPIPPAPDYRAALVALLDAMPAPRSRKLSTAWDAARAMVAGAPDPRAEAVGAMLQTLHNARYAMQAVLDNWESGDLAGAVCGLDPDELSATIARAEAAGITVKE